MRATDSLLFEPDQDYLMSIGMVSVNVLLPSSNEGKILVPLETHFLVAANLESGTCVGHVTIVTKGESVEGRGYPSTYRDQEARGVCIEDMHV